MIMALPCFIEKLYIFNKIKIKFVLLRCVASKATFWLSVCSFSSHNLAPHQCAKTWRILLQTNQECLHGLRHRGDGGCAPSNRKVGATSCLISPRPSRSWWFRSNSDYPSSEASSSFSMHACFLQVQQFAYFTIHTNFGWKGNHGRVSYLLYTVALFLLLDSFRGLSTSINTRRITAFLVLYVDWTIGKTTDT